MGEGRDESRTAATQPGDGVEHLLLDHRHPSDRAEDLLDGERVVFRRGLAQGERGRALPDGTGQVRHDADDPTAAGEAFSMKEVRTPAARVITRASFLTRGPMAPRREAMSF